MYESGPEEVDNASKLVDLSAHMVWVTTAPYPTAPLVIDSLSIYVPLLPVSRPVPKGAWDNDQELSVMECASV